ncbi:hypothetical protein DERP_009175 [Dermatophagoides pteronyssinus]|uniref:Uncharacterized protein n=1 Tax=Dermatophagoides pteronyssinus TaxID=6956 RepID=A0ABQ8JQY8_DERPT|nr:hypothetical protein DERP_009175 [Dermatophagoides pteronyssinus]
MDVILVMPTYLKLVTGIQVQIKSPERRLMGHLHLISYW